MGRGGECGPTPQTFLRIPQTSFEVGVLKERDIAISMDGRGRCLDNIFIERLWRSLKYEEVYLRDYRLVPEARAGISRYFQFYDYERPHQSLE